MRDIGVLTELTVFLCYPQQKKDLIRFCSKTNKSILSIDTTFNIGPYYLTVCVYRHPFLINEETNAPPAMIGPAFIHQKREALSYHKFASNLVMHGINSIQVFGTDGDPNLGDPFEQMYPNAIHLYCLLHIRANISKKINELNFNPSDIKQIETLIYGDKIDDLKVKGLVDAESIGEFDTLYEKFTNLLKTLGDKGRKLEGYFETNKKDIFRKSMRSDIRSAAGLGYPPVPYTQNAVESINALIKHKLNSPLSMCNFVDYFHQLLISQQEKIALAISGSGNY